MKCKVDTCDKNTLAKNLCRLHYYRVRNYGSLELPARVKDIKLCAATGCTEPFYGKDLCKKHYDQKRNIDKRDHIAEVARAYRNQNKEKIKQIQRQYRNSNPDWSASHQRKRRSRKINSAHSKYTLIEVLESYGTQCYICKLEIDLNAPRRTGVAGWENGLHIDHVTPLCVGGNDNIENVRPTHGVCNLRRSKKGGIS